MRQLHAAYLLPLLAGCCAVGNTQVAYRAESRPASPPVGVVFVANGSGADGNFNGVVDPADFDVWTANFGRRLPASGDFNGDGVVNAADYTLWRDSMGGHVAEGAGAEMRRTLGTAVFAGMLGVTLFGIFLTPVFYFVIQWFNDLRTRAPRDRDAVEIGGDGHGGKPVGDDRANGLAHGNGHGNGVGRESDPHAAATQPS